jgi:hypothetical protein
LTGPQLRLDTRGTALPFQKFDASGATWTGVGSYAAVIGNNGSNNICWHGGRIVGHWDQNTTPWDTYHSTAGVYQFGGPNSIFEDWYVENYGDAIRTGDGGTSSTDTLAENWIIRRAHAVNIHDDCIENDRLWTGLVEESLFEGCYVFYSNRQDGVNVQGANQRPVTFRNVIVWLKAMATTSHGTPAPGTGPLWKDHASSTIRRQPIFVENMIIRIDAYPTSGDLNWPDKLADGSPGLQPGATAQIVWTGAGPYPGQIPPNQPGITVTTDLSVYTNAVAAWKAAHPGQ